MKKYICLLLFAFVTINITAQEIKDFEINRIVASGSNELAQGKCEIELNYPFENYNVTLTPIDEFAQLYICNKSDKSFTVKSKSGKNIKFDYCIFEKKIMKKASKTDNSKIE